MYNRGEFYKIQSNIVTNLKKNYSIWKNSCLNQEYVLIYLIILNPNAEQPLF